MAATVYKKISELPNATLPLAGTEYIELSATGASKRGLWSGLFGSGWWDKLKAGFVDFIAPEALHANDAGYATSAGRTPNDYGPSFPPADATQHGRFFYGTGGGSGLYYCAQTSSSTYWWIKISS